MKTPKELVLRSKKDLILLEKLLAANKRPKRIIAFKYVNADSRTSPIKHPRITYTKGETISIDRQWVSRDVNQQCASGINVATWGWCRKNKRPLNLRWGIGYEGHRIIKLLVTGDIIVIPSSSFDKGKFRTNEVKVLS